MGRALYLPLVAVLFALLVSIAAVSVLMPDFAAAQASDPQTEANSDAVASSWLGAWSASPQPPYEEGVSADGFEDLTVRNIIHPSAGGTEVRVRLSNAFGDQPVTFGGVSLATQSAGAATVPGTEQELTFDGKPSVTVPAGQETYSDPVPFELSPGENLAVSVYLPEATGPTTWHELGQQSTYLSNPGDHTPDTAATAFSDAETSFFFISGLEVRAPASKEAVVALGNSITDGFNSTLNANGRYPDYLADRMLEAAPSERMSVLNAGISGNRILNDSPCCGVKATDRLERDVFSQAGVSDVILLEGINDIGFSELTDSQTKPHTEVSAEQVIAGMQRIIDRTHAEGLEIHGATLTPFKGADYYTEAGEAKRQKVNDFIRNSGEFDGVIDFDAATRDPNNPLTLLPEYDSGDHLHPNDAGYRAMAAAIDLGALSASGGPATAQVERMPDTGGPLLILLVGGVLSLTCGASILIIKRSAS